MLSERYVQAEKLYQDNKFSECMQLMDKFLWEDVPLLKDYVLRSKCQLALGQWKEAANFPWDLIDYKDPSETDIEALELIVDYYEHIGDQIAKNRYLQRIRCMRGEELTEELQEEERQYINQFYADGNIVDADKLFDYCEYLYAADDTLRAVFYHAVHTFARNGSSSPRSDALYERICGEVNLGMVYESLLNKTVKDIVFVIDRPETYDRYFEMARLCKYLDKKAVFVTMPVECPLEDKMPLEEALQLSYDNMEEIDGVDVTTTILYEETGGELRQGTLLPFLNTLAEKSSSGFVLLLAERNVFRTMHSDEVGRKMLHYVAANEPCKGKAHNMTMGYVGRYEKFEEQVYRFDILSQLHRESKHAYSIVLPVRNNSNTLPYTLKTCLEQQFEDYEIVVSDNSDPGNNEIKKLLEQFDSEKIHYVRTPRVLPLTKSFEFAYLQAQGDFVLPLGADDALLYGAIKELDAVKKELESREQFGFLTWDRLHYVWNDFKASGQSGQFIIPRNYRRTSDIESIVEERDTQAYLKLLLTQPTYIYGMPLLYINSGFKREYLLTVLEKTNAILDGVSQDIYTGVVNLALNDKYFHIKEPFTIAAIGGSSVGGNSMIGATKEEIRADRIGEYLSTNVLAWVSRDSENLFRLSDGDVANLLTQVFRVIDMECLDARWVNEIDWYAIGAHIYCQMQHKDLYRPLLTKQLLRGIALFSPDTAKRLDHDIRNGVIRAQSFETIRDKSYEKGFAKNGALCLDASEFGVENVYDAARLFRKICNLY